MSPSRIVRIEKTRLLPVSRLRVWRALTDATEFGAWFGVKMDGPFALGKRVTGQVTYPGYEHLILDATVECLDPPHVFAFRWYPYMGEPGKDDIEGWTTKVEFWLVEAEGGTRLTLIESEFERLPDPIRDQAFFINEAGWRTYLANLEHHVANDDDDDAA